MIRTKSFADVDRALNALEAALPKSAILDGHQLDPVALDTTTVRVPHKLGRALRGYIAVRYDSSATFWEDAAADNINLYLQASAPITVALWVY